MPEGRPGDALATVSIQSKVLFDIVAANVDFDFQLADARHGIDELVCRVVLRPHRFAIANEIKLECVSGATGERSRFALDHVRVLRFLKEKRSR